MTMSMDQLLLALAGTVGGRIVPEIPESSYAQGDAKIVAGLLLLLSQDVDRAADVLARENAAIRSLFAQAATQPLGELNAEVQAAAQTRDANLRVSTLKAANDELKELLTRLHAAVEVLENDWAQALNTSIWAILLRGAEERLLHLPSM